MSDIEDIYSALQAGLSAVQVLENRAVRADDYDYVRSRRSQINDGLKALETLRGDLRDGRKHVELPEDYKHTSCYCSAPTCSPPCSWCTEGKEREAEEEFFHPNDD
jgi:hypothetical protein